MPAVITPASALSQLAAASEAAPELVLQTGTVIDARVLAVRDNLARILIAGLTMEVLTEVALQPGANLKLAVSQTAEGIVRLAVVTSGAATTGQAGAPPANGPGAVSAPSTASNIGATAQASLPQVSSASLVPASPEALAVSQAVQASAPRQASLAPLFANLPVIVASKDVPQQVQTAATQLLATRPPLDSALTADDLRQAFQKSGLFLEATLARGAAPAAGTPDLKAALVVFKQVLSTWLGQTGAAAQSPLPASPAVVPTAAATSQPLLQAQVLPTQVPAQTVPPTAANVIAQALAPALAQNAARATVAQAQDAVRTQTAAQTPPTLPQVAAREPAEMSVAVARSAMQAATQGTTALLREPAPQPADDPAAKASAHPPAQMNAARPPSEPAPPFRGATPSPQPIALPSLAVDASPANMGRELLDQTDAALARQTLLQVASLPDRPELNGANQNNQARWSFEIPFATPQGTAMAQFEIARDGGNDVEAASSSRVWRARFTLDVEPAGPVHALVSLIGDKTAVRMWAERPETAAQLRANTDALGHALRQAELEPGDILVGEGAPPQPKPRAGRFLDRAT
jgi:hypothetical protein